MAVQAHYNDNDYKNWIRTCLGLQVLKEGIVDHVDAELQQLHRDILTNVCQSVTCNSCSTDDITKRHQPCPKNVCDKIYHKIKTDHRYGKPYWQNTDATKWCTNHWEIAKCFMPKGDKTVTGSAETDTTGILTVCINWKSMPLTVMIQPPVDIFHKNREARNTILHSGSMSLSDVERNDYIQDMVTLLTSYKQPIDNVTQDAIHKLRQLNGGIFITPTDELTVLKAKLDAIDISQVDIGSKVDTLQQEQELMDISQRDRVDNIQHKLVEADNSHQELKNEIETVQNEQEQLDIRQHELESKLDNVQQKQDHIDIGQHELESKLDNVQHKQDQIDIGQHGLESKLDNVQQKQDQIDIGQHELESKLDNVQQKQDQIDIGQHGLESKLDNVQQKQDQIDIGQRELESNLDKVQQKQEQVDISQRGVESKVGTIQQKQEQIDASQRELESRVSAIQEEQQQINITAINEDIKENGESLVVLSGKLAELHKNFGDNISEIHERCTILQDRNDDLQKYILDLSARMESTIDTLEDHESRIDQIRDQTLSYEIRIDQLEDAKENNDSMICRLNEELGEQKSAIHTLVHKTGNQETCMIQMRDEKENSTAQMKNQTNDQDCRICEVEDKTKSLEEKVSAIQKQETRTIEDSDDAGSASTSMPRDITRQEQWKKDIQKYLIAKYQEDISTIPVSPILQRVKTSIDHAYTKLLIRVGLDHKEKKPEPEPKQALQRTNPDPDLEEVTFSVIIQSESGTSSEEEEEDPCCNYDKEESYEAVFHGGNKPCRKIHVFGNAGIGKTTWSRKLVGAWADTVEQCNNNNTVTLSSDETELQKFDLVFYVELRHAKADSHISEMIEHQLFRHQPELMTKVKALMLSEECSSRCLIVLDGLDEWVSRNHSQSMDGLPERDPRWKSTVITTTRSWKLEELQLEQGKIDRTIEIKGLQEYDTTRLVGEVVSALNASTGKSKAPEEFEAQCHESMRKCLQVPLMLTFFVCLWYEEGQIDELMAGTFCGLVELLIKYAEGDDKKGLYQKIPSEKLEEMKERWGKEFENCWTPNCFGKRQLCELYFPFLMRLGKMAFEHLFSQTRESTLVFDYQSILNSISEEELDVALNTGILSQTTHRGSVLEQELCLSFLHKTVQEYLAALYMASSRSKQCLNTYSEYCTDAYKVLEMENILMFVSGLCPEVAGEMSRHIASMISVTIGRPIASMDTRFKLLYQLRNFGSIRSVSQLLLRCMRQEYTLSGTVRHIYIKYHFLNEQITLHNAHEIDYNKATAFYLKMAKSVDTTLEVDTCITDEAVKHIGDIRNVQLIGAILNFRSIKGAILQFSKCLDVESNCVPVGTGSLYFPWFLPSEYLQKIEITEYRPGESSILDLSGCNRLKSVRYEQSTASVRLPSEQLEEIYIHDFQPDVKTTLDMSECRSLKTLFYERSSVAIRLPCESLETLKLIRYEPSEDSELDLSACKSLKTIRYEFSTVAIRLPFEDIEKVEMIAYKADKESILDMSKCKLLRKFCYKNSTVPIQLSNDQLEHTQIRGYRPRNESDLNLSGCTSLQTLLYMQSTAAIRLSSQYLKEIVIVDYKPSNESVLDLSESKMLRTLRYGQSKIPLRIASEHLQKVEIKDYKPKDGSELDLSGCKYLRTLCYKQTTAPIRLLSERLETVEIVEYTPRREEVLDLFGCPALRTVDYRFSPVPILLPSENLAEVKIIDYKPRIQCLNMDLSECKSLRTVCFEESTVSIKLPTEHLEKVEIRDYQPSTVSVLDMSECRMLKTLTYTKSSVPIRVPPEHLEKIEIRDYRPDIEPVLDLSGCKSLKTLTYVQSTASLLLPSEQLQVIELASYTPTRVTVLDLSGCEALTSLNYTMSSVPIKLPKQDLHDLKIDYSMRNLLLDQN